MERLSAQMQAELRYQKQAKKRRPNHIELDTSTGNETNILSGATTQDPEPARKRFKKSQAQVPSQEDPDSSVAPAETTEPVAPIQDSRRRLVAGVVAVTSEKRQAQGTSSKRGRKAQAGT